MKKYVGTKQIEAEPMTMGEAYKRGLLQAGRVPRDGEEDKEGYYVRYKDGYESWSPAAPFEDAYKCVETFLDRLKVEHKEVGDRFTKCAILVDSTKFREVVKEDYPAFLLYVQRIMMGYYTEILELRMDAAEGKEIPSIPCMRLGIAIEALKFGLPVRRKSWTSQWLLPYDLDADVAARKIYLVDTENNTSEIWKALTEDMLADDWEIILP